MMIPWGKWQDGQHWLPLFDHCLDVAVAFRLLVAQPLIQARLAASAGHRLLPAHLDRLAAIAFLHDLGKCNWGFQAKADSKARQTAGHLIEAIALLHHRNLWPTSWTELIEDICTWFDDGDQAALSLLACCIVASWATSALGRAES